MKKILVIKLDHIGDLILATPVFRSIKEQFPNTELDVLISKNTRDIVKNSPFISHIYTYESGDFDRENRINNNILKNNIKVLDCIRKKQYDLCIGLREDLNNIPIQKLCGAQKNISFSTNTPYGSFLDETTVNDPDKHAAEVNYDLLKLIGIEKKEQIIPEIFISDSDRKWALEFLKNNENSSVSIKIAMSIGGGWFLNWWPIENFARLGAKIKEEYKDQVELIVVGGKAEVELEQKLREQSQFNYISAVGKTTILQLIALFSNMDFVISNDGGPMHMATAAGTPVIALFGPSPYRRFGPLGHGNTIISKNFPCSPCPQFVRGQAAKCTDNQCMKQISVSEVFDVVVQYIHNSMARLAP